MLLTKVFLTVNGYVSIKNQNIKESSCERDAMVFSRKMFFVVSEII